MFLAPAVASIKPLAPVPASASATTIFSSPIAPVTAPAQPTSRPTSSHTTPAAHPPQNVTSTQPVTQQSSAAVASRIGSVSIADPAPNPGNDGSSSHDDAGNNYSNRATSSNPSRSFRRSQSGASTGTSVAGDSKVKIRKLEKNSGMGKWRQAAVFDNWVDDAMDQLLIGNLHPESNVAMVWLGWHLEGEANILHL